MLATRDDSIVVLIDMQPNFLKPIAGGVEVLKRCNFLVQAARLLKIPVLATEQYPSRMGVTHEDLTPLLSERPIGKMCFSCARSPEFLTRIETFERRQAILIGIETPICVNQTAHDLLDLGYQVIVAADSVGARSFDMHELALRRMQSAGAIIGQTESIVYEWLETAQDPAFKQVLRLVKDL